MNHSIRVLFELMKVIGDKLNEMDKALVKSAQEDEVTRKLMTVPGVGPVTAIAFRATIDSPESFSGKSPGTWQPPRSYPAKK